MQPLPVYWKRILIFIAYSILMGIPPLIGAWVATTLSQSQPNVTSIMIAILGSALVVGIIVVMYRIYKRYTPGMFTLQKMSGVDILKNIGYALILRVLTVLFSYTLEIFTGNSSTANDELILSSVSDYSLFGLIFFLLTVTFVAPLTEELLFRGLYSSLFMPTRTKYYIVAIMISAALFSYGHVSTNFLSFLMYAFMGIVLHLAYLRRRNIWDSIMVHAINNGLASIVIFLTYTGIIQVPL